MRRSGAQDLPQSLRRPIFSMDTRVKPAYDESVENHGEKQNRHSIFGHRRPAARRPNPRQQSDAARAVPKADRGHAGARRPLRRAEAIDPHRHELPLLRGGWIFVHGEAKAGGVKPAFASQLLTTGTTIEMT